MACLLAWAQGTFLSIAANYVQKGVEAAINQFRYMCCLKKFQEELNQEEHALNVVQKEVHRIVEKEGKSTKVPDEPVEDWINRTEKTLEDVHLLQNAIQEDKKCLSNCCPNWFWRYDSSKEAEGLTETLRNLKQERSQFQKLTHEAELPNIEFVRSKGLVLSKASEAALADIMTALESDGVNMIGLHGMPGVGKTTLTIQVKDEAESRRLFDEFVKVTVTEKPNLTAIQDRIAEQLQLKFDEKSSIKERASKLMLRLRDERKKLLVLDDVWGELNLNEIGIPPADDLKHFKILITTRRIPVCESMNCQLKILLDTLTEAEAWALFKMAARLEDDSALTDVAKMVAKECGRLPVALVSVGKALRGKPPHGWERALRKIQEGEHQEIRDLSREENAYKSLKFSFDELEREETKRCLLLCSLFPEDYEISAEDLARYVHGLGLYQRTGSFKDTMSDVLDALDELKDSHLLLEAESKGKAKMHDLVRDIVLLIGKSYSVVTSSKTEKEFMVTGGIGFQEWPTDESFRDFAALSLLDNEMGQLPDQLDYPRLEMLLLSRRTSISEGYVQRDFTNVMDKSFEGMEKLQVLSITRGILSMQSLEILQNLRTLELRYCKFSSERNATATAKLASLSNLKRLEILSFYGSDISELPDEMGELKNLKLLNLANCYGLDRIPPNMIRKLSKLEELHIGTFIDWEYEGNASPMDIHRNSLPHLAILSVNIHKIPKGFALSNLVGYHIHICDCEYPTFLSNLRHPASRTICLLPNEGSVNAVQELFKNVYDLRLECNNTCFQNLMPDMSQTGFQEVSRLDVYGCTMECLISTSKKKELANNAFSNLVELEIGMTTLSEICQGSPPEGFLQKLQILKISSCDQMVTIFPAKLLRGMQKLERVEIDDCEVLAQVFELDGLDETNKECLSYLKRLELYNLDALVCIWKGPTDNVNLTSLTHLTICYCGSLASLFSVSLAQSLVHLEKLEVKDCDQLEYVIAEKKGTETFSKAHPQQRHCLQNLKSVIIEGCNKMKYVFPVAQGLPNLTELHIKASDKLLAMFGTENQVDISNVEEIVFPKLLNLFLEELPSLLTFCPTGYHYIFPSLQELRVKSCPEMTTSFTAAQDAIVYAKPEAPPLRQDTTIESAATQVIVAPRSADSLDWYRSEGKWITEEEAKKEEEEEEEEEEEKRT
ncbi:probable disease resistance protein At4g27220 [Ricinus communis]|uniref:Disease resistance protein RPS2, putative n=1 Tax=Ricinus communis TaxID=3988 RepID=B9SAE6_RICCO|nr:probable disease resistance protein At4g27220 [Ricinus communis]EEF39395.1 Disease resistance protein RPS2, putative [Ricinus communis]|eukprot:XP_002522965.1 probable disease resistance protein At4g27220 [Ricinus communis]